jgi:hypothetical protein
VIHGLIALVMLAVGIGVVGVVGVGLIWGGFGRPWSDDPGRQLADRIRAANSPLVQDVVFREQTMIDPPEVHVIVKHGVTETEAAGLWCDVVAPAGGSQFEGNLGALIYDDAGNWLSSGVECRSPQPS